jgi:serine/threonine-protein kinase RsbW
MASKTPVSGSIAVKSVPKAVSQVCTGILDALNAGQFSQEDIFAVHLALEEAFINAVKHGNKMDPTKQIQIDYSIGVDRIEISVTDQGNGFNPAAVPDPRFGENLYRPEGRGLLLIRSYMDVVEFNKSGNSLHMVRYKKGSCPLKK